MPLFPLLLTAQVQGGDTGAPPRGPGAPPLHRAGAGGPAPRGCPGGRAGISAAADGGLRQPLPHHGIWTDPISWKRRAALRCSAQRRPLWRGVCHTVLSPAPVHRPAHTAVITGLDDDLAAPAPAAPAPPAAPSVQAPDPGAIFSAPDVEERPAAGKAAPPVRAAGRIAVQFTERAFKTPLREEHTQMEQEV
jgi:hypothetical protein